MWGGLSNERMGMSFTITAGPLPAQSYSVPSSAGLPTVLYCLILEIFLIVASYDSQGYDGGIRPHLHTRFSLKVKSKSSQSQNYVTTDGQSAILSWNKAPIWGLRPDFYYCQRVAGFLMWGAVSGERTGLLFATVTVSNNKSVVTTYKLHFTCQ
jgi:hypothetical protein